MKKMIYWVGASVIAVLAIAMICMIFNAGNMNITSCFGIPFCQVAGIVMAVLAIVFFAKYGSILLGVLLGLAGMYFVGKFILYLCGVNIIFAIIAAIVVICVAFELLAKLKEKMA